MTAKQQPIGIVLSADFGTMEIRLRMRPRFDFGAVAPGHEAVLLSREEYEELDMLRGNDKIRARHNFEEMGDEIDRLRAREKELEKIVFELTAENKLLIEEEIEREKEEARHPGVECDLSIYCEACRRAILRQRESGGVVHLCQRCSNWKVQA